MQNSEFFKKLGVDSSNQWILYDEQMEMFFKFLSGNITDANILTERQVLEREEMQRRGEWLSASDRELKLLQIEGESPGLLNYKQQDVDALTMSIEAIEDASRDYATLLEDMMLSSNLFVLRHSAANRMPSSARIPRQVPACEMASMAYSTWYKRPSGEKIVVRES